MSRLLTMGRTLIVVYGPLVFWYFLAWWLLEATKLEAATLAVALWTLGLHFELAQRVDRLSKVDP